MSITCTFPSYGLFCHDTWHLTRIWGSRRFCPYAGRSWRIADNNSRLEGLLWNFICHITRSGEMITSSMTVGGSGNTVSFASPARTLSMRYNYRWSYMGSMTFSGQPVSVKTYTFEQVTRLIGTSRMRSTGHRRVCAWVGFLFGTHDIISFPFWSFVWVRSRWSGQYWWRSLPGISISTYIYTLPCLFKSELMHNLNAD
jgi:hypothetical protein